ncbi:TetR/AcrR family transcriptional regulator [Streptomyces ficellus]|uniref:TetR/AcrR family transcriptional regulator n=1 Tax=Streptomyces ficellus TaxID=1977088 RepID=A0A6I6FVP2_9ACTN|nr:TetR/AcrR family transcriptional regulator C-terminal domain-containing protein [Streptomyces ficellus]QGV82068.1 TetR/AcrR family transcriptional regulator [Streptomyces ficellus]
MPEQAGSGRRNRRRGRLSRDLVLTTALALVDREGLSGLSMRRLAAELGVEAMALYRYAAGKDALLDGLVEAVFTELLESRTSLEPEPLEHLADLDWRGELHRTVREIHRAALRHPQVVPLLATRMLAVPLTRRPRAVLRVQERLLALLARAGFDDHRTQLAYRAVVAWGLGYVFVELTAVVDDPEEPEPAIRLGLHRLPARELPHLRATVPALAEPAGEEVLAAGLDALLDRFLDGSGREAMT